jgi:hypothetical protein
MKPQILGGVLLGVALLAGPARASIITINFDDLNNLDVLTNHYPSVTFSASGGDVVLVTRQSPPYNTSTPPNLICTASAGLVIDCVHDLTLNFAAPVYNLTFDAFGNQTPFGSTFAFADVYLSGVLLPANTHVPLNVSHTTYCADPTHDCAADPQSLSYFGITRVVIHESSGEALLAGTAFDNFSFNTGDPTPEPSTLFLTGLCGIA